MNGFIPRLAPFSLLAGATLLVGCENTPTPLETATLVEATTEPTAARAELSVYEALQLRSFRANAEGSVVTVDWTLRNRSQESLSLIPYTTGGGTSCPSVGIFQFWIKRVGPDDTIPAIGPPVQQDETGRYPFGGFLVCEDDPWGPGEERSWQRQHNLSSFPTGRYRLYLDYKMLFQDGGSILATRRSSFGIGQ